MTLACQKRKQEFMKEYTDTPRLNCFQVSQWQIEAYLKNVTD